MRHAGLCALALFSLPILSQASAAPLLLRDPTLSAHHIVFSYGGILWRVGRHGGTAHPLITGHGNLARPLYSPNGRWIAFTATYQGNTDVYVARADGQGVRRLTFYPGRNIAVGWTPDSREILFRSTRYSSNYVPSLYLVPVTGGFPVALPLPTGQAGSFSPDGRELAYVPELQWERFWQHYQGGQETTIRIARLRNSSVVRIPHGTAEDRDPLWIGHEVYFLSNAPGNFTLFSYNVKSGHIRERLPAQRMDVSSISAGPDGIVLDRFGQIGVYDLATGREHPVRIRLRGNVPDLRTRYIQAAPYIQDAGIAPDGVRAVFTAFGKVLTVPAHHGSIENLTLRPGTMDRDPAWSPNGRWIAYFSDRTGSYDLYIRPDDGIGPVRRIALGEPNAFFGHLHWAPAPGKARPDGQRKDPYSWPAGWAGPPAVRTVPQSRSAPAADGPWVPVSGAWPALESRFARAAARRPCGAGQPRRHSGEWGGRGSSCPASPGSAPYQYSP